jgi:MarR family transcriptional regulator, organic hydroperoxide resistance regulator
MDSDKKSGSARRGKGAAGDDLGGFDLNNRLLFRVFQTTNVMHNSGTRWTADLNLTTQQWSVLGALARPHAADGMTVNDLSAFLMVSRQNLTGLLDRLEVLGLTQRVIDQADRRARRVGLTPKGMAVWGQLAQSIAGFYDRALEGFSTEEKRTFLTLTDRLQNNLRGI